MDEFQKSLINTIDRRIEKRNKKLKLDYKITSKVLSFDNSSNTYTLLYNGTEIQAKARDGLILQVNDIVYVRVIQGNFNNIFIDCKKP